MDVDIRKAIYANCSGNSEEELQDTIADAIQSGEDKTLPGLGVLFEVMWNEADENDRQSILDNLASGMPEQENNRDEIINEG